MCRFCVYVAILCIHVPLLMCMCAHVYVRADSRARVYRALKRRSENIDCGRGWLLLGRVVLRTTVLRLFRIVKAAEGTFQYFLRIRTVRHGRGVVPLHAYACVRQRLPDACSSPDYPRRSLYLRRCLAGHGVPPALISIVCVPLTRCTLTVVR